MTLEIIQEDGRSQVVDHDRGITLSRHVTGPGQPFKFSLQIGDDNIGFEAQLREKRPSPEDKIEVVWNIGRIYLPQKFSGTPDDVYPIIREFLEHLGFFGNKENTKSVIVNFDNVGKPVGY